MISVCQTHESESGEMVSEKVKWALSDVYLSQTMWNQTKSSMKQLKRPTSLISHWFSVEMVQKGTKLCKRKRFFSRIENYIPVLRERELENATGREIWGS